MNGYAVVSSVRWTESPQLYSLGQRQLFTFVYLWRLSVVLRPEQLSSSGIGFQGG